MGRIFLEHLGGSRLFTCANCDTYLTNKGELISTRLTFSTIPFSISFLLINDAVKGVENIGQRSLSQRPAKLGRTKKVAATADGWNVKNTAKVPTLFECSQIVSVRFESFIIKHSERVKAQLLADGFVCLKRVGVQ